ncbi:MAG: dihydropteroate synthase [Planctomycetaceae bacterium]|jgi:cobalamin-dependent methionine synthase I|nr:dihydropteroate synthase [Planctomycetaceae bacterium]
MPVFASKVSLIGESINDSVPSTKSLLDADDIAGIQNLAKSQDEGGADYIDVNIGLRPKEWMTKLVKAIQEVTTKPLSIDSPDVEICRAGLEAYNAELAGGKRPILNSISPLRPEMFDLLEIAPCLPILLISEQTGADGGTQCHTAEETYLAAKSMIALAKGRGLTPSDVILDPGIAPIGSDTKGNLKRLLGAMQLIQNDAELKGVHYSVGLSNFTVMLPTKRKDGIPIKSTLESAFLGKATALGLDMAIGSVKRNYAPLPDDHPAVQCLDKCLASNDFDSLMVVMQFYRG